MTRSINPLAATFLVLGAALGFTAHAALPGETAPTRQVDRIVDDPTPATRGPFVDQLPRCGGTSCPR